LPIEQTPIPGPGGGGDHDELHTVASHNDTTGTGPELDTLTDGSNADALHAHSGSAHTLASHSTEAHAELTSVGANDHHAQAHTAASHSDQGATGTELETLTDGSNADALHVHAGGGAQMARFTYTGDGATSFAITGLGFAPTFLKIWQRQTSGGNAVRMLEVTPDIIDNNASGMVYATDGGQSFNFMSSRIDSVISLDADGFTVDDAGSDSYPNTLNDLFEGVAFRED